MRFGIVNWISARFFWLWSRPPMRNRRRRRLCWPEPLEVRAVMANDMGAVFGSVFVDGNGDGYTPGEEIEAAEVRIYRDEGNGVFEPGSGNALVATTQTDSNGDYRFNGLTAGDYWVEQPAQIAGLDVLAADVAAVQISAAEAAGIPGALIDDFSTSAPIVMAADPVNSTDAASADLAASEAIGGERDLQVELTSSGGGQSVALTVVAGHLTADATAQAQGRYRVVWDGNDSDGATIDYTGLGGVDLTNVGTMSAIVLEGVLSDQAGATATLRVYSDATNFSTRTINIPANATSSLVFRFDSFVPTGNGADWSAVGAIELEINATSNANDIQVDFVQVLGDSQRRVDFDNRSVSDLSLETSVDAAMPNVGDNVTLTITVSNSGPDAATSVRVESLLPAGLTFVSSLPSQGTYNEITGVWTAGSVATGNAVVLEVVATVSSLGAKTLTAEVAGSDQEDPDSTPDNAAIGEDDLDSVIVTPPAIDLSLSMMVDNSSVSVGQNATFTLVVSNSAGLSSATEVVVTNLLPAGFTYVTDNPSQGNYDEQTGLWTVGTLFADANATLTIVATKTSAGSIVNTAEVTAADQTDIDSTPNNRGTAPNEDDSASVTVSGLAIDLELTSEVSDATPAYGDQIIFTLTLENSGAANATGVAVTNDLPAGWNLISATPSQGSYSSATGEWTIGAMNTGGVVTLQVVATVGSGGAKTIVAEVASANQIDVDSTPGNRGSSPNEDDTTSAVLTVSLGNFGPKIVTTMQPFGTGQLVGSEIQATDESIPSSGGGADFNQTFAAGVPVAVMIEFFVDGSTMGEGFWTRVIVGDAIGAESAGAGGAPIAGEALQNEIVFGFGYDAWLPSDGSSPHELVFYSSPLRTSNVETGYAVRSPLAVDASGGFHTIALLIEPRANDTLFFGQFDGGEPITWVGPKITSEITIGAGTGIGPQGVGETTRIVGAYVDYDAPTDPPPTDPPPTDPPPTDPPPTDPPPTDPPPTDPPPTDPPPTDPPPTDPPPTDPPPTDSPPTDSPNRTTADEMRPSMAGLTYGPQPAWFPFEVTVAPPTFEAANATEAANVLATLPRPTAIALPAPQASATESGVEPDGGTAAIASEVTTVEHVEEEVATDGWREHAPEVPKQPPVPSPEPEPSNRSKQDSVAQPAFGTLGAQSPTPPPQQQIPFAAGQMSREATIGPNDAQRASDSPGRRGSQQLFKPPPEQDKYFDDLPEPEVAVTKIPIDVRFTAGYIVSLPVPEHKEGEDADITEEMIASNGWSLERSLFVATLAGAAISFALFFLSIFFARRRAQPADSAHDQQRGWTLMKRATGLLRIARVILLTFATWLLLTACAVPQTDQQRWDHVNSCQIKREFSKALEFYPTPPTLQSPQLNVRLWKAYLECSYELERYAELELASRDIVKVAAAFSPPLPAYGRLVTYRAEALAALGQRDQACELLRSVDPAHLTKEESLESAVRVAVWEGESAVANNIARSTRQEIWQKIIREAVSRLQEITAERQELRIPTHNVAAKKLTPLAKLLSQEKAPGFAEAQRTLRVAHSAFHALGDGDGLAGLLPYLERSIFKQPANSDEPFIGYGAGLLQLELAQSILELSSSSQKSVDQAKQVVTDHLRHLGRLKGKQARSQVELKNCIRFELQMIPLLKGTDRLEEAKAATTVAASLLELLLSDKNLAERDGAAWLPTYIMLLTNLQEWEKAREAQERLGKVYRGVDRRTLTAGTFLALEQARNQTEPTVMLESDLVALAQGWRQLEKTNPSTQAFDCWQAWVKLLRRPRRDGDAEIVQKLNSQLPDYVALLRPETPPPVRQCVAQLQHELAASSLNLGRYRDARAQFQVVVELLKNENSSTSARSRQIAETCLAIIYESQGQLDSAIGVLRRLHAAVDKKQQSLAGTPWQSIDRASLHEITARVLIKMAEADVLQQAELLDEANGHLDQLIVDQQANNDSEQLPNQHDQLRVVMLRARLHILQQRTGVAEGLLEELLQTPDLETSLRIQALIELSGIVLKRERPDIFLADQYLQQALSLLGDDYDPALRTTLLTRRILLLRQPMWFLAGPPERFNRLVRRVMPKRVAAVRQVLTQKLQASLPDLELMRTQFTGDVELADNIIERVDFFGRFTETFEVLIRAEYDQILQSPDKKHEHALRCLYFSEQAKSRQLLDRLQGAGEEATVFPSFENWRSQLQGQFTQGEQILEYFAGRSHSYVMYYHAGRCQVFRGEPHVDASWLQAHLQHAGDDARAQLLRRLIPEKIWIRMCELNEHEQRLLIVPDGTLHRIPLESLLGKDKAGKRMYFDQLLERTATAYVPSLACLQALQRNDRPDRLDRLLTIAVEKHATEVGVKDLPNETERQFQNLPGIRSSCEQVHSLFDRDCGTRLYDSFALIPAVCKELDGSCQYSHVVIATHGDLDKRSANAAIMLSAGDKLLSSEIEKKVKLPGNQLVWIATCGSADGNSIAGEGQDSVARAFLVAGAPRVMATYSSIDNEVAKSCTQDFFRKLQAAIKKAGAAEQADPWLNATVLKATRLGLLRDQTIVKQEVAAYVLVGAP